MYQNANRHTTEEAYAQTGARKLAQQRLDPARVFDPTFTLTKREARTSTLPLTQQIAGRANAMYRDGAAHRDVLETLVEEGYDREMVLSMLRRMADQRRIPVNVTSPMIFAAVSLALILWGKLPVPNASYQFETLRGLAGILGTFTLIASGLTLLYHGYDRIPGLNTLLEPVFKKHALSRPGVIELDNAYLSGTLSDGDYERRLSALVGRRRGVQHFRLMRNRKHFGLE